MNGKIDIRIPSEIRKALERERRHVSRLTGTEVKMSSLIRALILEGVQHRTVRRAKGNSRSGARA
jgi:uncharacterized protein YjaZ